MSKPIRDDASPILTGLMHTGLSLIAFGSLGAGVAGLVQVGGDARDAGPRLTIALFDQQEQSANALPLKSRLAESDAPLSGAVLATLRNEGEAGSGDAGPDASRYETGGISVATAYEETYLSSDYGSGDGDPSGYGEDVPYTEQEDSTVRINGKAVPMGMSLATYDDEESRKVKAALPLPRAPIAGLREKVGQYWLPRISEDGQLPAEAYARPDETPAATPRVALVVGGLGINWRMTEQAIADLPAEVTLSFSPSRQNVDRLQYYIDMARRDGHEVLIEVPMEPYDWGRYKPEENTLTVSAGAEANIDALFTTLSRASGYFGVINYQGAKFATEAGATAPIMAALSERGLAFIEDASLSRSSFADAAAGTSLIYRRADSVIDADTRVASIEDELARLESEAMRTGTALGTGYAFPATVDTIGDWARQLQDKGIVLVPASSVLSSATPAPGTGKERQAALPAGASGRAG